MTFFLALVLILILCIPVLAASGLPSKVIVTVNRYAVWAPYQNDQGIDGSTFTAYSIVLDSKGNPVSGETIDFKIFSASSLVSTQQATTTANGLATVSYDVSNVITGDGDSDSGQWKVEAYSVSTPSVIGSTNVWYSQISQGVWEAWVVWVVKVVWAAETSATKIM